MQTFRGQKKCLTQSLLKTGNRPLELKALKWTSKYIMKVKRMPNTRIPHIAWEAGCKPQKTKKSKFITSNLIQDIRKWFAKWQVETYVDMHIEEQEEEELLNFETAILDALHNK